MAFRISRGIWQFQKEDGTYESKYKIATDGRLVETDAAGNEVSTFGGAASWDSITSKPSTFTPSAHTHDDRYYTETEINTLLAGKQAAGSYAAASHTHAWTTITGRPTALSSFTNDLGNYGSWITASHLNDYTNGAYRVIADYGSSTTWYIRSSGQFIWGNGHDWTQSFRLSLGTDGSDNGTWAFFGQQDSNVANGRYRGIRVRKYESGAARDGDLSAGAFYIGDTRKDVNWDTAYGWGNHASAGYLKSVTNISGNAATATTATNLGADYTADDWFRATADNNPVKFYGNTYQITWRTDGASEAYSGIGAYPFVWTYGGSSASNRRMLMDTSGNLWTNTYGWLHDYFQRAGSYAAASHTHTIANVTGLQSALDGKQAAGSYAAASHTHTIANVTGLQAALDGKQAAGSYLTTSGKAADSELIDGIDSSRIVYGGGASKISSHSNANDWRDSGFYENDGGGSNWPSQTWYNSINVRHSNQGNYHGFQIAMSYYDNNLWFRSYQGSGTFQSWAYAISSQNIGSQSVSYAATAGSAPANGGNSNTVGGLAVHGGRNNEANKVVRTDGNGYIQAGWINTTSGDNGTTGISRIYASQDGYIRYYTPANFISVLGLITTGNIGSQSVNYAASAGTADNIDGVGFRNTGSNAGTNADTIDSNGITYYTAGVSNFSGNATDGALYSQRYSTSWQHQIAGDYRSGQIAVRGRNNGTWTGWRTVLDSSNFSSWAQPAGAYASEVHFHAIDNIEGLQEQLNSKQPSGDYAASSHTHSPSQVGLGNVSNAAQVTTANNSSLNSDSRNTRGVTRLYRRDDNSDYSVQTYWTGSYWRLYGYNGDTGHADTYAGFANTANLAYSASMAMTATDVNNGKVYTTGNNLYIKGVSVNDYRIHHNGGDGVFDVRYKYSVREMVTIWSAQRVIFGDYMSYLLFDVDPWGDNWGIGGEPREWKTVNRGSFLTFGFSDYSDRRSKSAIVEIDNAVDKVKSISGYTYWKKGSEVREAGVIAQDVLAVLPEGVSGSEEKGYAVKPAALIGLLMKAVKEQQEMIDSLTARIEALENK
jgi:hypothetical protein